MYEELFPKTESTNFELALQAHFLDRCFSHFGKELFIYLMHLLNSSKLGSLGLILDIVNRN